MTTGDTDSNPLISRKEVSTTVKTRVIDLSSEWFLGNGNEDSDNTEDINIDLNTLH